MVQSTQNCELFDRKLFLFLFTNHFGQNVDAILEDISVAETDV